MFTLKFELGGYKFTYAAHSYSVSSSGGAGGAGSQSSYLVTAYSSALDDAGRDFHISSKGMYDKNQQFDRVYIENQSGKTIDSYKYESVAESTRKLVGGSASSNQ